MRNNSRVLSGVPAVVGTVHSPESLLAAKALPAGAVDFFELRVDHFAENPAPLLKAASSLRAPFIVTVRHSGEGGKNALGISRRRELFSQFLPIAAAIDVELRSLPALGAVLAAARDRGTQVIVSAHDFRVTPSAARLREIVRRAAKVGADIVKIAARADTGAELNRLLGLLAGKSPRPLSVMAMGRFGKISRLLFAQAGSVLNYAYLGAANASGQWSVRDFRRRLAELES